MNGYMDVYYKLKPFLPRTLQISLRRQFIHWKRRKCRVNWPINENAGKPPSGWPGWPNQKRFALVLTHDVETVKGLEKCEKLLRLEESLGFWSAFYFVPERHPEPYSVSSEQLYKLTDRGFEVGVHGLKHDGKLYSSRSIFQKRAVQINHYLAKWNAVGFRSPAMHHNLNWIRELNIEYDASTFDTDPFEPQSDGVGTVFPFFVKEDAMRSGYVELPYTLSQDFSLFVLMRENTIDIWKKKLAWIAEHGGMALVDTHPDYMNFDKQKLGIEEYPSAYYAEFLQHIKDTYEGQYWHVLPKQIARFFLNTRLL